MLLCHHVCTAQLCWLQQFEDLGGAARSSDNWGGGAMRRDMSSVINSLLTIPSGCVYLRCRQQEYADEARLKQLVTKYSEFINFPIYLQVRMGVSIRSRLG
jgi:hypothetical protein